MDGRGFVQRMLAFGLTAPMATQLLAIGGVAMAEGPSVYKPTKGGGGGALNAVVAGSDAAQSAFRHGDQGSGRVSRVL